MLHFYNYLMLICPSMGIGKNPLSRKYCASLALFVLLPADPPYLATIAAVSFGETFIFNPVIASLNPTVILFSQ